MIAPKLPAIEDLKPHLDRPDRLPDSAARFAVHILLRQTCVLRHYPGVAEKHLFRALYLGWLVAVAALCFAATGRHTREFYVVLRTICSLVFIFSTLRFAYSSVDCYRTCKGQPGTVLAVGFQLLIAVVFAGLAALFNPVAEFRYPLATWVAIDRGAIGFVLLIGLLCLHDIGVSRILAAWLKAVAWLAFGLVLVVWLAAGMFDIVELLEAKVLATAKVVDTDADSDVGAGGGSA
ncbi:MAG: hypothetical protein ABJB49_10590, partial [Nitrospirota bacterium]